MSKLVRKQKFIDKVNNLVFRIPKDYYQIRDPEKERVRQILDETEKERVRQVGTELLQYIQSQHPKYHAYPRESARNLITSPEGNLTAFIYEIKTKDGGRLSWLFPRILATISSDRGIKLLPPFMPHSTIYITDEGLEEIAGRLATKYSFNLKLV